MIAELIDKTGEARLTDLARGLGVTHVTANRTIKRLQRKGLVTTEPYRSIFLTAAGEPRQGITRSARPCRPIPIALGVPAAIAESDAEGIEHHVSRETLAAFRSILASDKKTSSGDRPLQVNVGAVTRRQK